MADPSRTRPTSASAVNGGQTATSTAAGRSLRTKAVARSRASGTVLYIFQFPATSGTRGIVSDPTARRRRAVPSLRETPKKLRHRWKYASSGRPDPSAGLRPRSRLRPRWSPLSIPPSPPPPGSIVHQGPGQLEFVLLAQRSAHAQPFCAQKGVAHHAADQQHVRPGEQVADDPDLVGDLFPTENSHKRPAGIL